MLRAQLTRGWMNTLNINYKLLSLVTLGAVLVAAIFGTTFYLVGASTPDASGKINACYRTNGGDLRVIDTSNPADTCSNRETPLSWDQKPLIPSAMGRIDTSGALVTSELKNITSWAEGTNQPETENGFKGYCLEVPFTPYIGMYQHDDLTGGFGGGYVVLKNSYSAENYRFDQNNSEKYCGDAKYNVYIYARNGAIIDGFDSFAFMIY